MFRAVAQFCVFIVMGASCLRAQVTAPTSSANDMNLTAEELAVNADRSYNEGRYAEALTLYRRFIENFGEAKEAQDAIRRMRFQIAMSYVQLKKFSEAIEAINAALAVQPSLDPNQRQELTFWKGICQLQEEECEGARKSLEEFIRMFPPGSERSPAYAKTFPAAQKIPEAWLLIGSSYLVESKYREAADFFAKIKPALIPVNRGRATVLQLHALLEADDAKGAMAVVTEEYPHMQDLIQLISFQTLTLQLGSLFLEKGDYRQAIICLQRIWDSERLLKHQRTRLADLETRLAAAEANQFADPYEKFLLHQLIGKVKREIKNFEQIPNFDSALRLRLAYAFQAMGRYRECALVLEAMLKDMPPDPVVESASVNLVQCWITIEAWNKAIEAAKLFVEKFPESKSVPEVLYLEGGAEEKEFRYDEAIACYDRILKEYKSSEYAPRALFMKGFTLLLAEKNKEGIAAFQEFLQSHPQHEMADAAAYWNGMGYSLDKQFAQARRVMDDYLNQRKNGAFRGGAAYRKAYCAQQLEDYQTSIKEFRAYLKAYPDHDENNEARVLLGDALMNEGQMDEGIASLKSVPKSIADIGLYEEAAFKVGKAYKVMEEFDKFADQMQAFREGSPKSPRVAEAIYNIGWVYRQKGETGKARDIYWEAIDEYGNDPAVFSVDDLFPALAKLYKNSDEPDAYLARLRDMQNTADRKGQKTLAMRALWAQSAAVKKAEPERANQLLVEAASRVDVSKVNPLLLADLANALLAAGKEKEGEQMWRDLVKWNPRAPQKDRAFAALGLLEMQRGNEKEALAYFDRFEKETMGSLLFGKIMLSKADLLALRGQKADALKALETLLANKYSAGQDKAQALYRMGEIYMKDGKPELAIPYYQRVYVMYGRWRDWVAKSYVRSGEAFEKLKDTDAARRSYQELVENSDMAEFQETARARERLNALGGPLPKPEGTPATAAQG